ncbi:hypothetical protein Tco_0498977, partial [Tanacetum coccineum]
DCKYILVSKKRALNFHEVHQLKLIDWEMILGTMKDDDEEENSKGVASSNCFGYYKEEHEV